MPRDMRSYFPYGTIIRFLHVPEVLLRCGTTPNNDPMDQEHTPRRTIVVAGLGMVALSFIEKVREYDTAQAYDIKVFSEEPHGNTILQPHISFF